MQFWTTWLHFSPLLAHWAAMPPQMLTWIGVYFVVAFSSCLDVARRMQPVALRSAPLRLRPNPSQLLRRFLFPHALHGF